MYFKTIKLRTIPVGLPRLFSLLQYARICILSILIAAPISTPATIALSSLLGHYGIIRFWKELLLLTAGIATAIYIRKYRPKLGELHPVAIPIALYTGVGLLVTAWGIAAGTATPKAAIHGLVADNGFLYFYLLCVFIGSAYPGTLRTALKPMAMTASMVAIFGILQYSVLPTMFLAHLGYGPDTIPAYSTIDDDARYPRAQSALTGPNIFGAYLLMVLAACTATALSTRKFKLYLPALLLVLVALYTTASRGAWVSAIIVIAVVAATWIKSVPPIRTMLIYALLVASLFVPAYYVSDTVRGQILHTTEATDTHISSNQEHINALKSGVTDVYRHPLGQGLGTAGPVSGRNNGKIKYAENYYLQIAQEVGVAGCLLFIYINYVVLRRVLTGQLPNAIRTSLLASFIGLSLINLTTHAWADSVIAFLWWGVAGLASGKALLIVHPPVRQSHEEPG